MSGARRYRRYWRVAGALAGITGRRRKREEAARPLPPSPVELVQRHADFALDLVAAVLVFFMQAGFACVETGFTRAKNACNIMMKNLMDF
jgi:hypothetical protein